MSRIEAGVDSPQALNGPVTSWLASVDADEDFQKRPESLGWELQITNEPSQFRGLTRVTITALKRPQEDPERIVASFTLRQLVRLSGKGADTIGEQDDLGAAAARGAQDRRQRPSSSTPSRPGERP
jgi:hypothetical protein